MEKNNRSDALFVSAPIAKAFTALCLPVVLGMIVNLLYNMVDTYFVGRLNDANQMAAVSLCAPVFIILMGLGNIFGIGGSSVISRLMGQKKDDAVRGACSQCFWCAVGLGIVMAVVLLAWLTGLVNVLGASDNTRAYAADYLRVIIAASPLILMAFTLMNILRCDGAAQQSMYGTMLGAVVNMILDPIFILVLKMGVTGAALATAIGYVAQDIVFVWYVLKRSERLSVSMTRAKPEAKVLMGVFAIGLPASITNVLSSVSNIYLNNMLLSYGDTAIAAMGIAIKIMNIVSLTAVGFAAGLPPIIGYNYGAGNRDRLREVMRSAFLFALVLGVGLTVPVFAAAPAMIRMFMDVPEIVEPGTQMLRALLLCGPFLGLTFVITNFFQATGKAVPAMLLSLCRQGVIFLGCLIVMNAMFGWNGIVYAQTAADYITLVICAALFLAVGVKEIRKA